MLGDLIANLDRPDVTAAVLTTLDPIVATRIEQRAAAAAMAVAILPPALFATSWSEQTTSAGSNCSL